MYVHNDDQFFLSLFQIVCEEGPRSCYRLKCDIIFLCWDSVLSCVFGASVFLLSCEGMIKRCRDAFDSIFFYLYNLVVLYLVA